MKLSILIVNWNTKDLVIKAVDSVLENAPDFEFEVIVLDNASSDGSALELSSKYANEPRVSIVNSTKNVGFARGNNVAYEYASGDYALLLNPDTEVSAGALQELVDFLAANPEVGIVGPRLLNPDGTTQRSVRRFPDIWPSLLVFSGLHRLVRPRRYFMDSFDYEEKQEVDQVMGAALMTRKDIIDELGLFDEKFFLWYEEVDFCKRVKDAGFKVIYLPEAQVMHHTAQSFSQLRVWNRKKTVARSLVYYFKKHGTFFEVVVLKFALVPILSIAWFINLFGKRTKIRV